jgi:hypothetical protein
LGALPDPIESAAKGATSAVLDWSEQKVRDLVKQFRNHQLAFIKNADNIELIKQERQSSEFSILKQFVPKGPFSIQVQMGLALRQIARDQPRTMELKGRIQHKYGPPGLHVAETTQIGITSQLLTHLAKLYSQPEEVTKRLVYFFDHVEDLVVFVKKTDIPNAIAKMVLTRIESFTAHIIILFGSGYASDVVLEILKEIKKDDRGYVIEVGREGLQTTAFIFTPELRAKISHWSDSITES